MSINQLCQFPWRSMLYVPANVRRFVEKAHLRGADAIVLDLEDSVADGDKQEARRLIAEAAQSCRRGGDVIIRVNRPLDLVVRDIEAVVLPDVAALMLPKIDSASHVRLLAELVEAVELHRDMPVGHTRLIPMVETAAAFSRIFGIAAAHPRNIGLSLGGEDFALSTGADPLPEVFEYPKQHAAIAARAAGIAPVGTMGTVADYQNLETVRSIIAKSVRFGFEGGACIHPSIVPLLNEGFSPAPEAVAQAKRLLAAYREAAVAGRGSAYFEGKMIDAPIAERAERLIERARRFQRAQGVE
ncbi:HpcH/HpaI aldolase/citrate lyase family protein [Aquibaculum arenosum]|uniref:CoA ester lyase n=1 Tax=Aquibaculum arenosum TaxID=3032591 RepID=A0ABT5YRA0_9PROT|nr:CoA ester lyase [Fodinicurvata sp. CAU 1616]MDF2097338.1 CoA ester lyase [Fodinicurvata sp. CAU 1616]